MNKKRLVRKDTISFSIKNPDSREKSINKGELDQYNYPIFCFKYLQAVSIKDCKDSKFFFDFLMRLQKLSELGWKQIRVSDKHSFGTEDIAIKQLKIKSFPPCITPDVDKLKVFRANGNNLPFLGIQHENIFRVIFIESHFGDIYEHS